jgi:transposase
MAGKFIGAVTSGRLSNSTPRVVVHRFPSYAPELNPDEFVWAQAKQELSNSDHDGLVPLTLHVVRSLRRIGRSQALLRSCLHASDLPWP